MLPYSGMFKIMVFLGYQVNPENQIVHIYCCYYFMRFNNRMIYIIKYIYRYICIVGMLLFFKGLNFSYYSLKRVLGHFSFDINPKYATQSRLFSLQCRIDITMVKQFRISNLSFIKMMVYWKCYLHNVGHIIHPDSIVHGAYMGPIWGRQDPVGPHVGPMILVIWAGVLRPTSSRLTAVVAICITAYRVTLGIHHLGTWLTKH